MADLLPFTFRCMVTFPCLTGIFTKGDNFSDFLFAALVEIALPHLDLLLKLKICPRRTKFFFF